MERGGLRERERESGVECIELQFQFDDVLYVLSFSILLHIYIGLQEQKNVGRLIQYINVLCV